MSVQAPDPTSPTTSTAASTGGRATRVPAGGPPEWGAERAVKRVGKVTGAVGKVLDRLATKPVIGPVVKLFSSVVFGLVILGLIGCYIAIGSGFANLRASFEMTDLEFFDAWPMRVLLVLLVLDLSIVTLRRIPLTLFKLGSWTVHTGILTLIAGCVWYFSCKEEGSVRIYLNKSADACYDVTERALYAFKVNGDGSFDTANPAITRMPGLPIYYEHLAERGKGLNYPVKGALAGLDGRMKDVGVRVVGYYPAAVVPDGVSVVLTDGTTSAPEQRLFDTPAKRILDVQELPFGIEYLRHPTATQVKDLQAPFDGEMGLTVRVPGSNVERTYAAKIGEPIVVEGTPYTLVPKEVSSIPMVSKGYEGAVSSMLTVAVTRKDTGGTFEFERQAIFRFPERSPDWVMQDGQKKRIQGGVDPGIELKFHDNTKPQIWIVEEKGEGGDSKLSVIYREKGKVTRAPMQGDVATLALAGLPQLKMVVHTGGSPMIIPAEQRRLGQTAMDAMQLSIIEVEVSGKGQNGEWKRTGVYVPFSPFASVGKRPEGEEPAVVDVPGVGKVGLLMATTKRAMPSEVTLKKFEPIRYPGSSGMSNLYQDYISTIEVKHQGTGETRTLISQLNGPAVDQGLYYFQSGWDGEYNAPPEKRYTVLGVANRPGVHVMTAGALLMVLGIGYAFYVKPILLKAKKGQVAAWASGNTKHETRNTKRGGDGE